MYICIIKCILRYQEVFSVFQWCILQYTILYWRIHYTLNAVYEYNKHFKPAFDSSVRYFCRH